MFAFFLYSGRRRMRKVLYHYQDTEAMTQSVLAWIADPASRACTEIDFSANCGLSVVASYALVRSPLAQTITTLEFTEIYFSAEQLADLLHIPALTDLRIVGGTSSDWNGPEYIYPTLTSEHLDVLATSPDAQRLRVLILEKQNLGDATGQYLRRHLPDLPTLWVEYQGY
jgi:hypothetical protein